MGNIDNSFTSKLRRWLDDENRDYAEGAMLLFRLRGNRMEFAKLSAEPDSYRKYIFDNIRKFHDFRAARVSHEMVKAEVTKAVAAAKAAQEDDKTDTGGLRSGLRADHASLPQEIQDLVEQNKTLILKIADLHTKLRAIISSDAECKDADLFPFAQEIIRLDKRRLANWKVYDNYRLPSS